MQLNVEVSPPVIHWTLIPNCLYVMGYIHTEMSLHHFLVLVQRQTYIHKEMHKSLLYIHTGGIQTAVAIRMDMGTVGWKLRFVTTNLWGGHEIL